MKSTIAIAALAVLVVAGTSYTQQAPRPTSSPPAVAPTDTIPPVSVAPAPPANIPPSYVPVASQELTVDQMLDRLQQLRAQKAEIEKKEHELLNAIRKKVEKQTERLERLGVTPRPPEPLPSPPSISR
jgi:hypothetical protein